MQLLRVEFGCGTWAGLSTNTKWAKLLNLGPWKCLWVFMPRDSEATQFLVGFFESWLYDLAERSCGFLKNFIHYAYILVKPKVKLLLCSDSSDASAGPNENDVEISFDKAASDKRNVKQIALHNGKWWTSAEPCRWLSAKGKFEATHMFWFGNLSFNVRHLYTILNGKWKVLN